MNLKNPTSNIERDLLYLLNEERKGVKFGEISLTVKIQNDRLTGVEISSVKKSIKFKN
jgi:hypothetical protein